AAHRAARGAVASDRPERRLLLRECVALPPLAAAAAAGRRRSAMLTGRMPRFAAASVMAVLAAACSGSSAPGGPTPSPAPIATTSGRVTNALTDDGVPGVSITGAGVAPSTSDGSGNFTVGIIAT